MFRLSHAHHVPRAAPLACLLLIATASCQKSPAPPPERIAAAEEEILKDLLYRISTDWNQPVLLGDKTISFERVLFGRLHCSSSIRASWLRRTPSGERTVAPTLDYVSVVNAEAEREKFWQPLPASSEEADGHVRPPMVTELTSIAFNRDHTEAVVGVVNTCGSLCGYSSIKHYTRDGDSWIPSGRECGNNSVT